MFPTPHQAKATRANVARTGGRSIWSRTSVLPTEYTPIEGQTLTGLPAAHYYDFVFNNTAVRCWCHFVSLNSKMARSRGFVLVRRKP